MVLNYRMNENMELSSESCLAWAEHTTDTQSRTHMHSHYK